MEISNLDIWTAAAQTYDTHVSDSKLYAPKMYEIIAALYHNYTYPRDAPTMTVQMTLMHLVYTHQKGSM